MPLPALSLELRHGHGRALSVAAVAEALALSCSLAQETLNPCHAQKEGADGGLSGEVQTSVYSGVLVHGKCALQCTKRNFF